MASSKQAPAPELCFGRVLTLWVLLQKALKRSHRCFELILSSPTHPDLFALRQVGLRYFERRSLGQRSLGKFRDDLLKSGDRVVEVTHVVIASSNSKQEVRQFRVGLVTTTVAFSVALSIWRRRIWRCISAEPGLGLRAAFGLLQLVAHILAAHLQVAFVFPPEEHVVHARPERKNQARFPKNLDEDAAQETRKAPRIRIRAAQNLLPMAAD